MAESVPPGVDEKPHRQRSLHVSIHVQLLVAIALLITLTFGAIYYAARHTLTQQALSDLTAELMVIAEVTAAGIDGDMHQALYESDLPGGRPLEDDQYRELVEWLYLVQEMYGKVTLPDGKEAFHIYPYTYVAAAEPGMMAFVGSAGALRPGPEGAAFRELDSIRTPVMRDGLTHTSAHTDDFIVDRWGIWVTGTSPIYNSQGEPVGAVGIDMQDLTVLAVQNHIRDNLLPAFGVAYIVLLGSVLLISYRLNRPIIALTRSAEQVIAGSYQEGIIPRPKGPVSNEITTLTRVFDQMIVKVQKRETTLSNSQARYRALVDSLPGPSFLSDETGAMRFISPQIEDLLGYTPEEWVSGDGRMWMQLIHPDRWGQVETMLQQPNNTPNAGILEVPFLHKDGHYHWIESRFVRYLELENSIRTVGIILDIESRQQDRAQLESYTEELSAANQKLQDAQQKLIQSARLVSAGELATGVAHEINNPLTAVHGLAQLLVAKLSEDDDQYEPLNQILHNAERISRIVHQLRGFTIDTSERTPVNLNDIAEGALTLLRTQLAEHQIKLNKEYAPDLDLVHGVSHQLEQVVINLLTNARDAITETKEPGQITLRTWHSPADHQVCLSVTDTGAGISSEHRRDLFTSFFTTKPADRGTGLGLHISHQSIREH